MRINRWLGAVLLLVLFSKAGLSQQLRLGINPFAVEKSAVLELQSTNQGLLLTRIADTALINVLNPPDGMVVYFTPAKQLLLRVNGYWQSLTPATSLSNYWSITGNSNGAVKQLGTTDNYALPFVTNNIERMRIGTTGNVGIGTTTPSQKLDVNGTIVSSATTYPNYGYNTANRMAFGETNVPANETGSVVQFGSGSNTRNMLFAFTKTNVNTSFLGNDGAQMMLGTESTAPITFRTGLSYAAANIMGSGTEAMRITSSGVGIGVTNPVNQLVVKDVAEIRRVGSLAQLIFSNTAGSGDFRIAGDGGDLYWQGGGARALQMGSFHTTILGGDRQTTSFPAFTGGITNTGVLVQGQRDASVPLAIQANSATQTANLTEWRSSSATESVVDKNGNFGIGTTTPSTKLHIVGNNPLTLTGVQAGTNTSADSLLTITNGLVRKLPLSTFANAYTSGNLTETGSNVLTITGGTNSVLGSGATVQVKQAGSAQSGFLSSADWNTFNNKLSSIDTTNIANFYLKVRGEHTAGTGISYNATTGVIGNTGVTSVNGNTGALTMDTTFISNFYSKVRSLFSAGSGISYNSTSGVITATGGAGSGWSLTGNTVTAEKKLGTIDNYDLPFITNNTEQMRLDKTGNLGIGTSTFDGTAPEKMVIDAGVTNSYNLLIARGTRNGYLQFNITNESGGGQASTDIVATANNGTETTNYVDLGINGGGYNGANNILSGSNNGYLYSAGNDFIVGNSSSNKDLILFTGGTATSNERMRITSAGKVGVGNTNPAEVLDVTGNLRFSGALMPGGSAGTAGYILSSNGAGNAPSWIAGSTATCWALDGNSLSGVKNFGTTTNHHLPFITNNVERMRITNAGNVGIGTTNPSEVLDLVGNFELNGALMPGGSAGTSGHYLQSAGAGVAPTWVASSATNWVLDGNNVSSIKNFGTTNNQSLPFITNSVERMRITNAGNVGIGTSTFDGSNPEKFLVNAGTTSSFNLINAKGTINNYLQLNIQNLSSGGAASSDVVATANDGDESTYFVDMGINSSGYSSSGVLGGAHNAYLYSAGNDFVIGNQTAAKNLIFFTGGNATNNERMRIDGTGKVGIGTTSPAATLDVAGTFKMGSSGTALNNMIKTNISITDNTNFGGGTTRQVTATVTGATTQASVILNPRSALTSGIVIAYSYISSANTITIGFTNATIFNQNVGSVTFDVTLIQ